MKLLENGSRIMNKRSKIIIAVSVIVIVATLVGVLCWGLQPVQKDEVSLKKLNKKLGDKYCVPSELPFEGDVECFIVYNVYHWNLRFELNSDDITGYSIELKDSKREISIETGDLMAINAEAAEELSIENYNNQKINYVFRAGSDTLTENLLILQFGIDGKAYQINARYSKDVNSETLKSDIECLLKQMIK